MSAHGGCYAVLPAFKWNTEKLLYRAEHSSTRKPQSDSCPEEMKCIRTRRHNRHNFVPVIADLPCTVDAQIFVGIYFSWVVLNHKN